MSDWAGGWLAGWLALISDIATRGDDGDGDAEGPAAAESDSDAINQFNNIAM